MLFREGKGGRGGGSGQSNIWVGLMWLETGFCDQIPVLDSPI